MQSIVIVLIVARIRKHSLTK